MVYLASVLYALLTSIFPLTKSDADLTPIFVAFSGNNRSVYDAWRNQAECNPVLTDLTGASRERHLRSPLIDRWSNLNIKKVKIELYNEDCMLAWLVFDGSDTQWLDWFRKDKLLGCSFDGVKENKEFEFFSMVEMENAAFVIQRAYHDCSNDFGWFIVLDGGVSCEWTEGEIFPLIMYTRNGTPRNWNNDAEKADRMVVYILRS